jgi:hypothetical protein
MDSESTPYPDAPWHQDRGVAQGRPQRRAAAFKLAIQGFEGPVAIPHWIIFIAGGVVGAIIALYATSSKS